MGGSSSKNLKKLNTNMERKKTTMNPVMLDWNWCDYTVFNI